MSSRQYYFIFTRHIAIFAHDSARYGCQVSRIRNVGDLAEMCIDPSIYTVYLRFMFSCTPFARYYHSFRFFVSIFLVLPPPSLT